MTGRAPLPTDRASSRRRRRHVQDLRVRVASGTYRVRAEDVADAILRHLAGRRDR